MTALRFAKVDATLELNPKIEEAGFWASTVYQFLLRVNRLHECDGRIPARYLRPKYIAKRLDMFTAEGLDSSALGIVERAIARCQDSEVELLERDGDEFLLVGWDSEWKGAKTEAERSKDYRDKKKRSRSKCDDRDAKEAVTIQEAPSRTESDSPPIVTDSHEPSRSDSDDGDATRSSRIERREEKRRKEESNPPKAPQGAKSADTRILNEANSILVQLNAEADQRFSPLSKSDWGPVVKALTASKDEPAVPVAELALIVEHRCALWLGTEREEFLRPKTLFAPDKLSGYRSAARKWHEAGRPSQGRKDSGVRGVSDWENAPDHHPLETPVDMTKPKPEGAPF